MGIAHSSAMSTGVASNTETAQILTFALQADSNTGLTSKSSFNIDPCVS